MTKNFWNFYFINLINKTNFYKVKKFVQIMKTLSRIFLLFLTSIFLSTTIFSTVEVIDVQISETVNQFTKYNPLELSAIGAYADIGENQSQYEIIGTIFVENKHPTESIENIKINLSSITNLINITHIGGNLGIVSTFNLGGDSLYLVIPDLGPNQNSSFTYYVNSTLVAPPINFTTNFSQANIFSGLNFGVTDIIENVMNVSEYTNNCIYNLQITQDALTVDQTTADVNFTFTPASLAGTDVLNAIMSGDNRRINWNVSNNVCINSGDQTDISYSIEVPVGFEKADTYEFLNTTISYNYNDTLSGLIIDKITGLSDLEIQFEKYQENILTGDNATWKITSQVDSETELLVNLTKVSLWVSQRNGTGTGFTNPSLIDNDTISGAELLVNYNPNVYLNTTTGPWDNLGSEWYFNYTFSSSPIVWMDAENTLVNDGIQISNRSISYDADEVYIKEIYVATGYWLEISKNISRISEGNFQIDIKLVNKGSSGTPSNQAVVVYNFLPNTFALTSPLAFSQSLWYNTDETNATLNDPTYNGTMYQFALLANSNPFNSSLDLYGGSENLNNTWTLSYNVSGSGEFAFDDLFLTGVDPLNVGEIGGTSTVQSTSEFKILSAGAEYVLIGLASIVGILVLLI